MSFKGHFLRNISDETIIASFESLVRGLPENSPILSALRLSPHERDSFSLLSGEIGTILGIFESMKSICESPDSFPIPPSIIRIRTSNSTEITATNALSEVIKTIRRRLPTHFAHEDENPIIISTRTNKFPMTFKVKCLYCDQHNQVSISLDNRPNYKYNIQTLRYAKHLNSHLEVESLEEI